LTAFNSLSAVQSSVSFNAINSVPPDVSITIVFDNYELPPCQPDGTSDAQAVYVDVGVTFEASTPISASLTYEWVITTIHGGEILEKTSVPGTVCSDGQSCTTSSKV
jgi:hypothetical protein